MSTSLLLTQNSSDQMWLFLVGWKALFLSRISSPPLEFIEGGKRTWNKAVQQGSFGSCSWSTFPCEASGRWPWLLCRTHRSVPCRLIRVEWSGDLGQVYLGNWKLGLSGHLGKFNSPLKTPLQGPWAIPGPWAPQCITATVILQPSRRWETLLLLYTHGNSSPYKWFPRFCQFQEKFCSL